MKGADVAVPFVEKAPRMELIFRLLYLIPYFIVTAILGVIVMYIALPLQFLAILILGKRIEILHKAIHALYKWVVQYAAYLMALTDERPPIMPSF